MTEFEEKKAVALLEVVDAVRCLTYVNTFDNGFVMVGPAGWRCLQEALHRLDEIESKG